MKVLDLFSGIGGMSLGLERAGMETVAFCECDKFCQKVLKKHWPKVKIYEDITNTRFKEDVDLVTAGFPCQDISFAGQGAGITGDRSGLFWYILRTLCMVGRPRVLLENVAGLLNRGLGEVLGAMASFGYDTEWHCIPAGAVGAPHRRDRIWIVGNPKSMHSDECENNKEYSKSQTRELGNADSAFDVANNRRKRIQGSFPRSIQRQPFFSWCESLRGIEDLRRRPDLPKPVICRTNDGVRRRLHGLGNAVVPQIPEIIGLAIIETERKRI